MTPEVLVRSTSSMENAFPGLLTMPVVGAVRPQPDKGRSEASTARVMRTGRYP